ncbi:MAG: hypothetical protein DMG05_14860 [Acidobacteria bacterium]|nr:MAG: hypothetical protein DMG05_14860 [Acidobacteriota bacterium]
MTRQGPHFLDAPCSGTGTLQRHPEIRCRLQPSDVEELQRTPCLFHLFFEEEENENVISGFPRRHPEFSLDLLPTLIFVRFLMIRGILDCSRPSSILTGFSLLY